MRKGFTLIEIMVATMLLAMLVTILTMIFNQSSIAWTTGVASVTALGGIREEMSVCASESDNVILDDRGNSVIGVTSVWDLWDGSAWTTPKSGVMRTLKRWNDFEEKFRKQNLGASDIRDPLTDKTIFINGSGSGGGGGTGGKGQNGGGSGAAAGETFLVGVHSYGPDGKTGGDNSWDDISTMPEEIVK